jgi:penicillin-binding protein-related factor A (putative recombinase)
MIPDWKKCELDFQGHWKAFGKRAFCHRFSDTAQAKALNGVAAIAPSQPSDYLVCFDGLMFLAEVKHSADKVSFSHSNIRPKQMGVARMCTPAGGAYFFFVFSKHLGKWFRIPASVIIASTIKSTKWCDIMEYEWTC